MRIGKAPAFLLAWALLGCGPSAQEATSTNPHAGLRYACRHFIEQVQLEARDAIWGDTTGWQIVDNPDGTHTVGARYAVAGRTRLTMCVISRDAKALRLEKLIPVS